MIAAHSPRRSGLPLFAIDRTRIDSLERRRVSLASASRWTTAVLVWLGIHLVMLGAAMVFALLRKFGWIDDGVSLDWGSIDSFSEVAASFVARGAFDASTSDS